MKRKWKENLAFSLIILLTLFSSILSATENQDLLGLILFKNSSISSDPGKILSNWLPNSSSPCSFAGVTCSVEGHVSAVDLSGASLSGTLELSKITTLPFLTYLNLAGNHFSGNLSGESPPQCRLEILDLSSNNFSHPLSAKNIFLSCTKLLSLNLSNNNIHGGTLNFPPSISLLDLSSNMISDPSLFSPSLLKTQNLNFLNLSNNNMIGNIGFISNLPQTLKTLDFSHNNFTQDISDIKFSSCKNLSVLNLSYNKLVSSVFPPFLMTCPLLEDLNLGYNNLEFKIPGNLLANLKNLRRLNLARNRHFGEIPTEMGKDCAKIEELDLSNNSLFGELPSSFSNCLSLESLNLGENELSGGLVIIDSLVSLKNLTLSFNNFTGNVPLSLFNNSKIVELDLSSNAFTGQIPTGFCLSSSPVLQKLSLSGNYFSGEIPTDLAKCIKLRHIDLSFNEISGKIPIEIWHMPNLSDLVMWANNLTGELPKDICSNHRNLQMLILNNNLFWGNLPPSISNCTDLIWLSLSNNLLSGHIPPAIGNLPELAILQLANNSFSGEIPKDLGNCTNLIWLELSSNLFTGTIPKQVFQNTGLVKAGAVAGKKFKYVRNEGGTACRGAGSLVEFEGIRDHRLENYPMAHSCSLTRLYPGQMTYTFETNGSMIYLDLSYNKFSNAIPDNMGFMTYLTVLNLGHNNLTGEIPFSLGGLKHLTLLDLSHNNLQGSIPSSLQGNSFLDDIDFSYNNLSGQIPSGGQLTTFPSSKYENNKGLCGPPLSTPCVSGKAPSSSPVSGHGHGNKDALTTEMVVGVGVCLICIFLLLFILCWTKRKHIRNKKTAKYIESLPTSGNSSWKLSGVAKPLSINVATFENPLRKLTFAHLLKATNGFSSESLIGSGGFGEVYKAQLKDGSLVAIKKLINATTQGDREFVAEMETIGKIKHRNLVPLLGYCKIGEERLLVYDYMKWGSLESVLHENSDKKLDWMARKKIAIGSARGLAFLHHSCIPHIIHRDMKSSNVLLDEDFEAKVSDFGMARLVNALDSHLSVSTLAGTPGYVPPEYYQSFRCTTKGDVYSYGVILLELLSGKKPIDAEEFGEDNNLVGWAKQLQKEKRTNEILDPELVTNESRAAELYQYLRIAFECLEDRAFRRPTMIEVMSMFRDLVQADWEGDVHDDVALKSMPIEERQEKET